jgi:DNA-binding transcriptional regulator YdaS (Cro superfamily)
MKLSEWQKANNLKNKDLAQLFNVDESYICLILQGQRRPSPQKAAEIEKATKLAVSRMELLYPD